MDVHWNVEIGAYFQPNENAAPGAPDLGAIFAQLSHPRTVLASVSPIEALATQSLAAGRSLILRSTNAAKTASSFLFLGPD